MDGDLVSHSGVYEGGFRDERLSRLDAVLKLRKAQESLNNVQARQDALQQNSVQEREKEITECLRLLQRLQSERDNVLAVRERAIQESQSRQRERDNLVNLRDDGKYSVAVIAWFC
jgi:chromosome segregation ATPase